MNLNTSRHLRAFAIAAVPLFLIAGAAFASSAHSSLTTDPTSGPKAESTDAPGATGSPVLERAADETKAPEAIESSEPTKAPEASESSEPTKAPEANESSEPTKAPEVNGADLDKDKDKDLQTSPGALSAPDSSKTSGKDGGFSGNVGVAFGHGGGRR
jgi:hypothetical protein